MLYTHRNAGPGARVYDVEAAQELRHVMSIDTVAGTLLCATRPLRVNAAGNEVETFTVKFDSIHPIHGMEPRPVLFHCYGRKH